MDNIIVEQTYPYSMDQVWEALTDPAALADWLMPGDFKAVVGHKVELRCDPKPGFDGVVHVEVLHVDKPKMLSYSWTMKEFTKPTIVTFTLQPTRDGGTHLRLEHKGFEGAAGKLVHSMLKEGWGHKLSTLLGPAIVRLAQKGEHHGHNK
jgi:uncharacterized protein YndB with AHSA1/START domain